MTSYRMALAAASLLAAMAFAPAAIADKKQPANQNQAQDKDAAKAKKHKHSKKHDKAKRQQSIQSAIQKKRKDKAAASGKHEKHNKKNAAPKAAGHQPSNGHSRHGKKPAANVKSPPQAPNKANAAKTRAPNTFSKTHQDHNRSTLGRGDKSDHHQRAHDDKHKGHEKQTKPAQASPPHKGAPNPAAAQAHRKEHRKKLSADEARKRFDNLRHSRKKKVEAGGKVVIEEPGRRMYKVNNRLVIQHDERDRLRKVAPHAHFEKEKNGVTVSVVNRPGNVKIYSEIDQHGRLIRRYRRGPKGHDTIIIDNRRRNRHHHRHHGHDNGKDIATGIGIGLGVAAGAAILNAIVDVPEPVVRIPRDQYIVEYDGASEEDVYDALSAPPIGDYSDRYTLDEIRATSRLRDRMRRIDLDDINFEFGSWEVDPDQYHTLERIARAMKRVIRHNPNEVFLIEGYTDAVGSDEDNMSLSDRRAESVAVVLTEEFDVPFENIVTQGYGEQYLKVDTDGPERLNRRVAVRRITPLLARDE
jgi:outer membrane protein OmpA-like peptidoglycan-associated protein